MGRLKHIIVTVTNDLSYDRRMQRICRTLTDNGYQVTLVGRLLPASIPLTNEPYEQIRLKCLFNKGFLFYKEYNIRLLFFLLKRKADIHYAVDLDTLSPAVLAGKLKGRKIIYDAHEYFTEVPEVVHRPLIKKSWEMIARLFIPSVDVAITVGDRLAAVLGKRYGKAFHAVRNVPDAQPKAATSEKGQYLLYQGALNKGRGLEQLIDAMPQIDMPLKIAGEGDLSQELRARVKKQGLNGKIEFLGYVKPADLSTLTSGAFLGLNLLENTGLSYYYSLANKFFDYIQAAVPSLNMNFPEYQLINDTHEVSVLLDSLNSDSIARAVNGLIKDEARYQQLQQNCLEASKLYNWGQEQKKLITLLQQIDG